MANGRPLWSRVDRLLVAALLIGAFAPAAIQRSTDPKPDGPDTKRTLAERRVRPVQPTGPSYAIGASITATPEETEEAFNRLSALVGDWIARGTFSVRPDLPLRTLSSRLTIDWDLGGMQLKMDADHEIDGPQTHLMPRNVREVTYLTWNRTQAHFDGVAMHSRATQRFWFEGAWDEESDSLTLYGALIGRDLGPEDATVRIEFTRESESRWLYRTAARDPGTRQWLERIDAVLEPEKLVQRADARE